MHGRYWLRWRVCSPVLNQPPLLKKRLDWCKLKSIIGIKHDLSWNLFHPMLCGRCTKALKLDTTWGWFGIEYRIIITAIYRQHWAGLWHVQRPMFQVLSSGSSGSDGRALTPWFIQRWSAPLLWLSCCSVYWLSRAPTCSWSLNGLGRKLDCNQARYWGQEDSWNLSKVIVVKEHCVTFSTIK